MRIGSIACLFATCTALWAQTPKVSILEVQTENLVTYYDDTSDISKWGTLPGPVPLPANLTPNFKWRFNLGDVVSVNGQPVKGNIVSSNRTVYATTDMTPGRALMDLPLGCPFQQIHSFMLPDGTVIGTIAAIGVNTVGRPPGAPSNAVAGTGVVVGGSGAFLGVRGQAGLISGSGVRNASITEDPAYHRVNGGGKMTWFFQIIPAEWPEVLTAPSGPLVVHSADFSLIAPDKPARAGEVLTLYATGLGPTRPGVDPGKPFPATALQVVNSPVQVVVNGTGVPALWAGGYPGAVNTYQGNFRLPDNTVSGLASLSLNVAWISGSEVKILVK
jgi:uncharacterized protein (TIGR03437 family)